MNCLVIVDMQEGFMNESTEHLKDKLISFLKDNSNFFDFITATRYVNHENTACSKFEGWYDCMEGSDGVQLIDGLFDIFRIFDKDKYSCYNQEFKEFLRANDVDEVYFVGVNTGCCVLHSAFDTYNDVISTYVIEDLCGSTLGQYSHDCAIQMLKECITEQRVINSSTLK